MNLLNFCIGHQAPLYDSNMAMRFVGPFACESQGSIYIPDDLRGPKFSGRLLSEYLPLFEIGDFCQTQEIRSSYIGISQYRKFVGLTPGIHRCQNTPYAWICRPNEGLIYTPKIEELANVLAVAGNGLIGPVLNIGDTLSRNYHKFHIVEDFIHFCVSLSTVNGFAPERISRFVNFNLLIPAPSIGIHRLCDFLDDMKVLKEVWFAFQSHYLVPREGYQRRVGGFLLERLHSYLILERFLKSPRNYVVGAQFVVVSEGLHVHPTI